MTTAVPANWATRARYKKWIRQLNAVKDAYPVESKFAMEFLPKWVEDIPSFYDVVSSPYEPKRTLEQMEDYLNGKNPERQYYGDFMSECVNMYSADVDDSIEAEDRFSNMFAEMNDK